MEFSGSRRAYSCPTRSLARHGYHSDETSSDLWRLISTEESHRERFSSVMTDAGGCNPREPCRGSVQDEDVHCPTIPKPQVPRLLEMSQTKSSLYDRATWLR